MLKISVILGNKDWLPEMKVVEVSKTCCFQQGRSLIFVRFRSYLEKQRVSQVLGTNKNIRRVLLNYSINHSAVLVLYLWTQRYYPFRPGFHNFAGRRWNLCLRLSHIYNKIIDLFSPIYVNTSYLVYLININYPNAARSRKWKAKTWYRSRTTSEVPTIMTRILLYTLDIEFCYQEFQNQI